jgi:hypothetical protein
MNEIISERYHIMDGVDFNMITYNGEKYVWKFDYPAHYEAVAWIVGRKEFDGRLNWLVKNNSENAGTLKSFFSLPESVQKEVRASMKE